MNAIHCSTHTRTLASKAHPMTLFAHAGAHARALAMSALLLVAATASAAIRTYDVSVVIDTTGTVVSGQTFLGSFSVDEDTGVGLHPSVFALTAFSFNFAGSSYELTGPDGLDYAEARFSGTTSWGLEAGSTDGRFTFTPGSGTFDPYFAFDLGNGNAGFGSVRVTGPRRVLPEPSPGLLLGLAAVIAVGIGCRRVAGAPHQGGRSTRRAAVV
jgi:hypothetical protein